MVRTRRRFSEEFKREAVRLAREPGKTLAGVARELKIGRKLLLDWREKLDREPIEGESPAELRAEPRPERPEFVPQLEVAVPRYGEREGQEPRARAVVPGRDHHRDEAEPNRFHQRPPAGTGDEASGSPLLDGFCPCSCSGPCSISR